MAHKDIIVAYVLWIFLGVFGAHRFYLNRPISGVIWLLTGGLLGVGLLVDLCLIPMMVDEENAKPYHNFSIMSRNASQYDNVQPYCPPTFYNPQQKSSNEVTPVYYTHHS
ncbi:hypothetical protein AKO1_003590 [Acrasis kona]|uniref:TM2 domain-containing protein n=1 Tax=Acrasis kona TaxID=1008807 RepID=A0AAW2Z4U9_9EUKA